MVMMMAGRSSGRGHVRLSLAILGPDGSSPCAPAVLEHTYIVLTITQAQDGPAHHLTPPAPHPACPRWRCPPRPMPSNMGQYAKYPTISPVFPLSAQSLPKPGPR
jgi:hypothetical protein